MRQRKQYSHGTFMCYRENLCDCSHCKHANALYKRGLAGINEIVKHPPIVVVKGDDLRFLFDLLS